jgi:hypothetical protein
MLSRRFFDVTSLCVGSNRQKNNTSSFAQSASLGTTSIVTGWNLELQNAELIASDRHIRMAVLSRQALPRRLQPMKGIHAGMMLETSSKIFSLSEGRCLGPEVM